MTCRIEDIGSLFLKRRKELGFTQEELGEKIGVSKSEISKIENGRGLTFATIKKVSDALNVTAEVELRPKDELSVNAIHFIMMAIGMFARQYNLSRKEAGNYLIRYKGLDFVINNYEVEHQLSLEDCVEDMVAICKRNGGAIG